jgi:hypothetical protein
MTEPRSKPSCPDFHALAVKIEALEKQMHLHVDYQQTAVDKASAELRARLDGMNEFREALKDQATRFVSREELEARHLSSSEKLQFLHDTITNWQGRFWAVGVAVTLISGIISAIVAWLIRFSE